MHELEHYTASAYGYLTMTCTCGQTFRSRNAHSLENRFNDHLVMMGV